MNYKDLDIQRSYISMGPQNIADTFLNPALKYTKIYKRSVGFFSSGVLQPILSGILSLARNHGIIELVASPKLSSDDMDAISAGYEAREKIINRAFERDFLREIDDFSDEKLKLLAELIATGVLDIKIAITDTVGDYHDKLGILEDFDGNVIVFYGSANSSINGYQNNYEKIRIVRGWMENERDSVADEQKEFDSLWNGTNPFVQVYSYKESAQNCLLVTLEQRAFSKKNAPIVLRDYQEEAIASWVKNQYHGFYVMATGTGKTWTAIFSAKKLIEEHPAVIVICAPYKHLVRQWAEDVVKAFPNAKLVLVSSENPKWEQQLSQTIIKKKYAPDTQLIVISTIASFKMKRFDEVIKKSTDEKLLIVDEAHRFTDRSDDIKQQYQYLLGLSATPYSGTSAQKGIELMQFFGGQVFSLPIEKALDKGYLVPYFYHPIYVHATDNDEKAFQNQTKRIISCFKNNICINPDLLVKALRARLRVISMAEEKQNQIDWIISQIKDKDHCVVYCGDGKLFGDTGEEIRHISNVKRHLDSFGYRPSQFTCEENMDDRMQLVDAFNKGEISALAAIRCLDEGINIPSIKSALILSSNDDYREFVQRRGRILRLYPGKAFAHIYDVVVLPSIETTAWAKIELRRFREYAKLSKNWEELQNELNNYLDMYGLTEEDVDVYDYENMEDEIDE